MQLPPKARTDSESASPGPTYGCCSMVPLFETVALTAQLENHKNATSLIAYVGADKCVCLFVCFFLCISPPLLEPLYTSQDNWLQVRNKMCRRIWAATCLYVSQGNMLPIVP